MARILTDNWHLPWLLLTTDKGPDRPLFSAKPVFKTVLKHCSTLFGRQCDQMCVSRSSQLITIGIDLSIDKSIKIGKSDLIDIDCIDQSVEIDDTLVSFIDLSRFYRFHRFISEDTPVLLFIHKWKLIHANSEFVDNGVAIESRRIKQFIMKITFFKKKF